MVAPDRGSRARPGHEEARTDWRGQSLLPTDNRGPRSIPQNREANRSDGAYPGCQGGTGRPPGMPPGLSCLARDPLPPRPASSAPLPPFRQGPLPASLQTFATPSTPPGGALVGWWQSGRPGGSRAGVLAAAGTVPSCRAPAPLSPACADGSASHVRMFARAPPSSSRSLPVSNRPPGTRPQTEATCGRTCTTPPPHAALGLPLQPHVRLRHLSTNAQCSAHG